MSNLEGAIALSIAVLIALPTLALFFGRAGERLAAALGAFILACWFVWMSWLVYIAVHFITKYW